MTLSSIWWWVSSSEDLGNMEYYFIPITPMSTLTGSGSNYSIPSMGQVDILELFIFNRIVCKKIILRKLHKKSKFDHTMNAIL